MTNSPRVPPIDLSAARFVQEAHTQRQMPPDVGLEIAFAGRSNAGKSSILNALCRRNKLARTSRTPGRTQNFGIYEFAPQRRFIDLPGFGFAKVSKSKRSHWAHEIPHYFETRTSLIGLVLVADSRHPLKEQEKDILVWCRDVSLDVMLLWNKIDKLKQRELSQSITGLRADLQHLQVTPAVEPCSATTNRGIDKAKSLIAAWFQVTRD